MKNLQKGLSEDTIQSKTYDKDLFKRIIIYLKPYKLLVIISFILLLFITATNLLAPVITQRAVDEIIVSNRNLIVFDDEYEKKNFIQKYPKIKFTEFKFDDKSYLIFVVRDIPSKDRDTMIAKHIIRRNTTQGTDKKSVIEVDLLTKYLSYAKRGEPQLTPEAETKILDYYLQMRNVESEEMITVTPRQLEGIIRLSTARARLLMKDKVEEEDADRAIFLIQSMLQDAGVDVNTGKVDLGVLQGKPRSEVSKMQLFMDVLKGLEGDNKVPVEERLFVKELEKSEKFTEEEARNYIRRMLREASIYESKPGNYNRV